MKHTLTSLAAIACLGLAATTAHATDGVINFTGQLVDVTCKVMVNGTPDSGAVNLPTLAVTAFANAGDTAGDTPFKIDLANCSKDGIEVVTDFLPGPQINSAGRLTNMAGGGGAQNVELEILDAVTTQPIKLADASQLTATHATITDSAATLPYVVRYYATGSAATADAPTPGPVTSMVSFLLSYP